MKYEFTGETKVFFGVTLKRIRALVSFGIVVKGELGGWIESDKNLSQVSGNAWVSGNALVYGDARVYGDAWVSGDARVSGNAQVSGDADFFFVGPIGSRKDQLTVHADAKIGIRFTTGCFSGSESELSAAVTKTHKSSAYAKQYRAAMALALMVVKPKE